MALLFYNFCLLCIARAFVTSELSLPARWEEPESHRRGLNVGRGSFPYTEIQADQDYPGSELARNAARAFTYSIDSSQLPGVSVVLDSIRGDADLYVFPSTQAFERRGPVIAYSTFAGPVRDSVTVRNRVGTICIVVVGFDSRGSDFILMVQDSSLAAPPSPRPVPRSGGTGTGTGPARPSATPNSLTRRPASWTSTSSSSSSSSALSPLAICGLLIGFAVLVCVVAMLLRVRALHRKRARASANRSSRRRADASTGSSASGAEYPRVITRSPSPQNGSLPSLPSNSSFRHRRVGRGATVAPTPPPMPIPVPMPTPMYQGAMYPPPGMILYAPQPLAPGVSPPSPYRASGLPPLPQGPSMTADSRQAQAKGEEGTSVAAGLPSTTADARLCAVCLDREKNTVFGCGHLACESCAASLTICHMCRAVVTARIRVYG